MQVLRHKKHGQKGSKHGQTHRVLVLWALCEVIKHGWTVG